MYVWPVLLVWDTTLDGSYRARFQSWWSDSVQLLADRYQLKLEVRIIQLSAGTSVRHQPLPVANTTLPLVSDGPARSVLSVSSAEYREFEQEIRDQRHWLGTGPVVIPTIIRLSSRAIDRPDAYGNLLREVSQRVRNLQVFEYQVNLDHSENHQWLSEKLTKQLKIRSVVRQNFSPLSDDLLVTFFDLSLENLDEEFRKLRLTAGPRVPVRPSQPIARPPTQAPSSQTPPSPGKVPGTGAAASPPSTAWSGSSPKPTNSVSEVRPTREYKTAPSPTNVTASEVEKPATVTTRVEPTDSSVPDANDIPLQPVVTTTSTEPDTGLTVPDDDVKDVKNIESPEPEKDKSEVKKSWWAFLPWNRNEEADVPISTPPAENEKGDAERSAKPEPELQPSDEKGDAPRAKNGQLVVDTPSTINGKPWFAPKWFKIPVVGPARDVELEYGGINSMRLMAASVRGTRHEFYGEPNQDAFAIGKTETFLIVVVCDGVGSAEHSAYGSKYISYSVARSLSKSLKSVSPGDMPALRSHITDAVQRASDGVQTWNEGALFAPDLLPEDVNRGDLSATLVVGVVEIEPSKDEGRTVVVANVGDSPCYTFVDGTWTLRTAATKDGDVLEHATSALPTELGVPVNLEWHDFVMKPREQLLLMTDGIGTSLASGRTPLGKWLGERLAAPSLAQDFLSTVDAITFDRQGEDDDRTLVVLYDFDHAFTSPPESAAEESAAEVPSEPQPQADVPAESTGVQVLVPPPEETTEPSVSGNEPSTP